MEFRHPHKIWKDPKREIVDFGRVLGIGFFLLGCLLQWSYANWQWSWQSFAAKAEHGFILLFIGGAILTLSTITPWLMRPLYFLWMLLGQTLGLIVNRFVLAVIYYLVFTPVGLLYRRWCGVIAKRPDPEAKTYWEPKEIPDEQDYYYKQY